MKILDFTFDFLNRATLLIISIVLSTGIGLTCYNDNFKEVMIDESIAQSPVEEYMDIIPGEYGIIIISKLKSASISFSWYAATDADNKTPQDELEYMVISSLNNNINTVEEALNNGDIIDGWTAGLTSAVASGLLESTTYFFNVIVKDSDDNMEVYSAASAVTSSETIYVYNAGKHAGNMVQRTSASPRADLDGLCSTALGGMSPSLPCSNVRALISISTDDNISAMTGDPIYVPDDWKIMTSNGYQIASSWPDLLDGTIEMSFQSTGIIDNHWWSGSNSDGTLNSENCGSWMDENEHGRLGNFERADSLWIEHNAPSCKADEYYLMCVCW